MTPERAKPRPAPTSEQLLVALNAVHRKVKRSQRELQPSDRLVDDLDLDSLDAVEVLLLLEDELDRQFLDEVSKQLREAVTVDDLLALVRDHL